MRTSLALLALAVAACPSLARAKTVRPTTPDGVRLHGEVFFGELGDEAPLVLLFHQARGDGRGEYRTIAPWLNERGFRAIAWDQRSGGELFDSTNRTVEGLPEGTEFGYCDAYADLQTALDATIAEGYADRVFVWGSSYSAGLLFRLAAENPGKILGAVACSPASGGPMQDCSPTDWLSDLRVPVLALRPQSEMERESSVAQRDLLLEAGVEFHVVENGVHGSSMLVDDRTGHDMSEARDFVAAWLKSTHLQATASWNAEQQSVLDAIERLSAATAPDGAGPDAYGAVLSDDFSRWTLGGDATDDKRTWLDGVRNWFDVGWRVSDRKTLHLEVDVRDDLAFTRRTVRETYAGPKGESSSGTAALAEVWNREGGVWRLLRVDVVPLPR